jgi:hypothetical protein
VAGRGGAAILQPQLKVLGLEDVEDEVERRVQERLLELGEQAARGGLVRGQRRDSFGSRPWFAARNLVPSRGSGAVSRLAVGDHGHARPDPVHGVTDYSSDRSSCGSRLGSGGVILKNQTVAHLSDSAGETTSKPAASTSSRNEMTLSVSTALYFV